MQLTSLWVWPSRVLCQVVVRPAACWGQEAGAGGRRCSLICGLGRDSPPGKVILEHILGYMCPSETHGKAAGTARHCFRRVVHPWCTELLSLQAPSSGCT